MANFKVCAEVVTGTLSAAKQDKAINDFRQLNRIDINILRFFRYDLSSVSICLKETEKK